MGTDVENALTVRLTEPKYGLLGSTNNSQIPSFTLVESALKKSEQYFPKDKRLNISELISGDISGCPIASSLSQYWMAIEGVEPKIRQNPFINIQNKEGSISP